MLRVRPLVRTSDVAEAARFLAALGLSAALDPVPNGSYAVLDSGGGRVALRTCAPGSADEGTSTLAFDVGDVREFARRTAAAGTGVELVAGNNGPVARVTAPDGMSLLADVGPRETGAPPSPLSVVALWYTPDVGPAARVLADMGAGPRISSDAGPRHEFLARNGGLVAVRRGRDVAAGLAFEYDGDVRDLLPRLTADGLDPVLLDGSRGRSLRVAAPWGTEVRIDDRQRDRSGHTVH